MGVALLVAPCREDQSQGGPLQQFFLQFITKWVQGSEHCLECDSQTCQSVTNHKAAQAALCELHECTEWMYDGSAI